MNNNHTILYRSSFVAFIDILGFKGLVLGNNDKSKAIAIIKKLSTIIEEAKSTLEIKWNWEENKFSASIFSDCMCIAIPQKIENLDAFFQLLAKINSIFVKNHICIRGAVAIGNHYSDKNILFSEGLIKAYQLESVHAIYPRIIVPEEFWSYVIANGFDEDIIWFKDLYIWKDYSDNKMFIDYLNFFPYKKDNGQAILDHKTFIQSNLIKYENDEYIRKKYYWLAHYHNSWCRELFPELNNLLIDSIDEERNLGPFR